MSARILLVAFIGLIVGALVVTALSQRASYYWAAEILATTAATLEERAKLQRTQGREAEAKDTLGAAIAIREHLGRRSVRDLSWPLDNPWSFALDFATSPSAPALDVREIYSGGGVTMMLHCAHAGLIGNHQHRPNPSAESTKSIANNTTSPTCSRLADTFWGSAKENR